MTLHRLSLRGFRNYAEQMVDFHPGVNVLCGENAQGKTNLLEAVGYLSLGRSSRTRFDRDLIGWGAENASLTALCESRAREFHLEVRLARGVRRRIEINGVVCKTSSELSGILRTVLFCPEDLSLIRDSASARRRFLDNALCQLRPRYAVALAEFHRLYEHKTRILRDWREKPSLMETLDDFNSRLCRVGAILLHYRARLIQSLALRACEIHTLFSGGGELLGLSYRTVSAVENPLSPVEELVPLLERHQAEHRKAELDARLCLSGVHKDDLLVEIDGRPARQFASQGQTRTAALSLKLAERELHFTDTGEYPVLLLDDVLSELDPKRQEFVLSGIRGGQTFITCCDPRGLEGLEGRLIQIKGGRAV